MATLRTMHKRRKRKLMIAAQPCQHRTLREYADGEYCQRCGAWFEMDFWKDEYVEPEWDDWDDGDLPELPVEFDWDAENEQLCESCEEPNYNCTCSEIINVSDYISTANE